MENKAIINKIINFSNVDGPGNRTAIFFQTCPFKCLYCHNPETINKCNSCGLCAMECPYNALVINNGVVTWNRNKCEECDTCIKVCPNSSSPKTNDMSVDDVMNVIIRNKAFIRGITVSGGECMNYAAFLSELFKRVKELGLTTFIDTNGYYDFKEYQELLKYTDYVMLDVKAYNNEFHKWLTKNDNTIVLRNLEYLLSLDKLYEVRTVLLNDRKKENLETVSNVSRLINDKCRYKLIKYRQFGVNQEGIKNLGNYTLSDSDLNDCVLEAKKFMNNIVTV